MSGERNFFKESHNGNLIVREFDIQGNVIIGYYDVKNSKLVFVLDCLINSLKPNVLLIINPDGNKKWDEIISNTYNANLETIRPKQDNKYQKLDIEYSGLSVYDSLITAFVNNEDLTAQLQDLNIVRNSAIRHSALSRLTTANEIITKTNTTILKTKEIIEKTQSTLKQLKNKLVSEKQSIGKKPTKQSAAKILRLESQIEAAELKLHKAKKRLLNAQKRLDTATAESDQATLLLNAQSDIKQADPAESQKSFDIDYEDQTDIQPLFKEDPHILDENNAFKPVSFNTQQTDLSESATAEEDSFVLESSSTKEPEEQHTEDTFSFAVPNLNQLSSILEEKDQDEQKLNTNDIQKPILETLNEPNLESSNNTVFNETTSTSLPPVLDSITPIITKEDIKEPITEEKTSPVIENDTKETIVQQTPSIKEHQKKNTIVYYILLTVLIVLSIFTLLLYQKHITNDTLPILAAKTSTSTQTVTVEESNKADILPADTTNIVIESDSTSVNMDVSENNSFIDEDSDSDYIEEELDTPQEEPNITEAPNDQQRLEEDLVTEEETSVESSPMVEKPIYNVSVDSVSDDDVFLDDFSNEEYYEE
ncbi:MAG: hypothetical protein MJ156_02560 [Alphaproteobacteria bacterium]|nr:hypothetical protein [Alphaproteobacteria bacterium]